MGLWLGGAAGLLLPFALAGCGQKGPLVMPAKTSAPAPTATPPAAAASAPAS